MGRRTGTMDAAYFEALYKERGDPWDFETSVYEREKYSESLAVLPPRDFAAALEVGCSIGVFTERLARRCAQLVAIDPSETALARARARCAALPVDFRLAQVPAGWPAGRFDLIVLSEVLYYLDEGDLARVAAQARGALMAGGVALLVHYLGETNYPISGEAAATGFIAASGLTVTTTLRRPLYRIDLLEAP